MRRSLFALVALALALPAGASAYPVRHPALGEQAAEHRVYKVLHEYPGWRYRRVGYVDCRFGRVNGYTWVCRVGWAGGGHCRIGRVRISNSYSENEVTYYRSYVVVRRC